MSGQQQRLPLQVDPFRLAAKEERLIGVLPLKQMKRLTSTLESAEGEVSIDVTFSIGVDRVVQARGQIKTEVTLICQRCMNEMQFPIELELHLAFVRSEAEMDRLPEAYEASLVEEAPVMLSDIIEDEILLVLPAIPRHPDESCAEGLDNLKGQYNSQLAEEDTEHVKQDNPFDILANLKKD
jgi:uncharacterized protein